MVYCGKPSKACHACRKKKSRCDLNPDGCGQCYKAGRVCPGYREEVDLMFRDESSNVIKKAKAREAKKKAAALANETPLPSRVGSGTNAIIDYDEFLEEEVWDLIQKNDATPAIFAPPYSLSPTLDDKALSFFVSNYVIGVHGPIRGHLDQIQDFYARTTVDETILSSVKAVGLAGYSYSVRSPKLLVDARKEYAKALQLTNRALRSPTDCTKDSTASAIVILGIFEMVTGYNPKSLAAWAEHIRGAAALLKVRGFEQLQTPTGCRVFGQVIASLTISCMQFGWYIPDHIFELYAEAARKARLGDPAWAVQGIMLECTNLLASVRDGTLADPQLKLDKLRELDERVAGQLKIVPPGWEFETIVTDFPSEHIYRNKYHVHCDYWVAHMFNLLRSARIMINEHIRRTLLKGFSDTPPIFTSAEHTKQFQKCNDDLYAVSEEILYTVPQHLGYVVKQSLWTFRLNHTNIISPISKAAGGYFLLWPLCSAAASDVATNEMREYGLRILEYIGHRMGIQLAFTLMT